MADTEQLRMKFLLELKRVEQLLAKGQLEGLETLLLGSQLLLNVGLPMFLPVLGRPATLQVLVFGVNERVPGHA